MLNELFKRLAVALDKNKIPYMIIGGQAALLYRQPRFTNDIDITLGIGIEDIHRIYKLCLDSKFRILVENPDNFIAKTMVLPVIDESTNIRIDFILSYTEYENEAITRSNIINIEGTDVSFCCLEDIIILKVFAGRPRDIEDIDIIIRKNPYFDRNFVIKTLKNLGSAIDVDLYSRFINIENNR